MNKKIFLGLVAFAFLYLASSLVLPILMGGVLAVLFTPLLDRLEKKKISRSIGSAILTFGITVVLILPASLLIFFGIKIGFYQLQTWRKSQVTGTDLLDSFLRIPGVHRFTLWMSNYFPLNLDDLSSSLQDLASTVGSRLTELLGGVLTHLPGIAVALSVVVLSIYFFLVDGPKVVHFVRRNTIFSESETDQLINSIGEMCRSVILAAVVSGAVQAILEVLTCVLTGTPNFALIGLLVFVGSFIPLVGSLPITLAVAIQQFVEGREAAGTTLLIMSVIIMAADNTIRPLFLRGAANLHPFLGFVAAFGGLQTIGFLGVFLGPILASLFVATIQILSHPDSQ